jgi:hypothetical protein
MTLYRHAPSKAALVDAVAGTVLAELEVGLLRERLDGGCGPEYRRPA